MSDDGPKSPLDRLSFLTNPNHDRFRKAKKHEQRIAAAVGGRRLPNSGGKARSNGMSGKVGRVSNVSFRGEKLDPDKTERVTLDGDVASKRFHIEHKSTERDSIAVKKEWLDKVSDGAADHGTVPAMVLTFVSKRPGVPHSDWALIPFDLFAKTWKVS